MKKYSIRYTETYESWYEVEANSPEEAKEKLLDAIMDGKEKGPDECCDSGCKEIEEITLEEYLDNEGIDEIEDDEEFCRAEFEAIREYCSNYNVTEEDIAEIRARGYEEDQFVR